MLLDEIIQRLGQALDKPALQANQLAKQLGVSPQTVRNWRDGVNFPNKNRWPVIQSVTNVSVEWIFQGDTKMRAQNQLEEQLLQMYREMRETDRDNLLSVANTFYNKAKPGASAANPYFNTAANDPPPAKREAAKVVRNRGKNRGKP